LSPFIIEVTDLSFDYPGFRALDRVSLSIEPGTVTALVGPNGAGKTTLLRCMAALETPTTGTVRVAGHDVYESPREVHRQMGFLSDNFGLYSELTVAQGLEYAARSQGLPAGTVAAAVRTTAQRMGLGDRLEYRASALSRGQRQRLAIGQAIIHSPQVLLLDEPASGLDPEARTLLTGVFKALQAQGMSLLVSSHILAELDQYSTHMLALNQGRVLEHRALGASPAGSPEGHTRRLRLAFIEPADAVAPWLQAQAGVRLHGVQDQVLEIDFTGSPAAQAALVGACVAAGYQLLTLVPVTENLQQSYLNSLQARRRAEPAPKEMA
jgi:ABC-2 type transport system ATP-binding protein